MKNNISLCILLFTVLFLAGCEKNDETTTLPSLAGIGITDPKPFVRVGEELAFKLDISDMYTTDNTDPGALGAIWAFNNGARDTLSRDLSASNPTYYVHPDTLGTFWVNATVFALNGKYYNGSISTSFQVIDPDIAITGLPEGQPEEIIGNVSCPVTKVEGLTWMATNLFQTSSGRDYRDCEVVSEIFGRYYTWEEAQTACPDGWRLPTASEFDEKLGESAGEWMADVKFMNAEMWAYWPQVSISNVFLFNALPTGYIDLTTAKEVFGYQEYACWWTSDDDGDLGVYRYIFVEEPVVKKGKGSKTSLALNVRCVKETD